MRRKSIGILLLSLLIFLTACSNQKEVQTTNDKKTGTFTVTGMECCPPSVVENIIKKLDGVSNAVIKASGSTGEAKVSFDEKKTNLITIKKTVSEYGFGVQ